MNSCNQCRMIEFQGTYYHETFCPTEVARRRAIKDPKPGSHEMYEFVIQKTADDWAALQNKKETK
jgi:hypothetical protein